MRKCRNCRVGIPKIKDCSCIFQSKGFCDVDCMASYGYRKSKESKEKKARKEHKAAKEVDAERKRKFYAGDIKTRKKAAKEACHLYIRTRDKDQSCICCGRPLGKSYDAGHFLESGNNSALRYHEDNIHAQSVYCNQYKGGDSDDYAGRLRLKIGDARVNYLLNNKGGTVKRTADDYAEIESYYKNKLKDLTHNGENLKEIVTDIGS